MTTPLPDSWRGSTSGGRHRPRAKVIVAIRFDCNEIGDTMYEITAYGTPVTGEREQA
jgi:hypothetical protein